MDSNAPLTPKQIQGVLAFLCGVPAFFVGFYVCGLAEGIGSHLDFVSVLERGGICSIPTAMFALLFPRYWFVPSAVYGLGFYFAYKFSIAIGAAAAALFIIPIFAISGQQISLSESGLSHSKPTWIIWAYLIAIWVAAFIAMLRLHFEKMAATR